MQPNINNQKIWTGLFQVLLTIIVSYFLIPDLMELTNGFLQELNTYLQGYEGVAARFYAVQ